MKKFFIYLTIINLIFSAYSNKLLNFSKRVAKVGDTIIYENEVEKYCRWYKVSFEAGKNKLIEETILYIAAKIYVAPPEEKEILETIAEYKRYYAARMNKKESEVTENEFLSAIVSNDISMTRYKERLKKTLWINKYLDYLMNKNPLGEYVPTEDQIQQGIIDNPNLYMQKEGVTLSMIYFSYYNPNGTSLKKEDREVKMLNAEKCLTEIDQGKNFYELASRYSDDLVSINAEKPGFVGQILLDDPKSQETFSKEIITAFKEAQIGTLKQIFETQHGLYLFKIESKKEPEKLSDTEIRMKVRNHLIQENRYNYQKNIRDKTIESLKKQLDVEIYK